MDDPGLEKLINVLLDSPQMQALWTVRDRGMPVFAHTVDVALLALERTSALHQQTSEVSARVITVGSLLHDLTKATAKQTPLRSHSRIMSICPELAADKAIEVLKAALDRTGQRFSQNELENIVHVVISHHGPWGRVQPATPEAKLVHQCDLYSALYHRIAPIDANDILPHLEQGRNWRAISALLGVGTTVLKQRIEDACVAEAVDDWPALLHIWKRRGYVLAGCSERRRQLQRAKLLLHSAQRASECIMKAIARV